MKISIKAVKHNALVSTLCNSKAEGVVHSSFKHAINLLFNNELISILDIKNGEFPNSILVDTKQLGSFSDLHLPMNSPARFSKHSLIVGNNLLSIDLADSEIYSVRKELTGHILSGRNILEKLRIAAIEGRNLATEDGLGAFWRNITSLLNDAALEINDLSVLQKVAYPCIKRLINGLRFRKLEEIETAAIQLSGLGIGLTPSGDDLLTGLISVFTLLGNTTVEKENYQRIVQLIIKCTTGKSNTIAQQMLLSASRQEITPELYNYIQSLVMETSTSIESATRQLFAYGHSSGTEMGLGAYLGVALINEANFFPLV